MNILQSIRLKNHGFYNEAEFDLDYEGITVVRGRNLNAKSKNRSNGSGKSTLVRAIPSFFYQSTPIVGKTLAKRTLMKQKDSEVEIHWQDIKSSYQALKFRKGAGVHYDITRTTVDKVKNLKHKTATAAEQWISNTWPLSEDQFYATSYLDIVRQNTMLIGTGAKRFEFFSDLLMLDGYDTVKEHFNLVKAAMRDDRVRYDTLVTRRDDLQRRLDDAIKIIGDETDESLAKLDQEIENIRQRKLSVAQAQRLLSEVKDSTVEYDPELVKQLVIEREDLEDKIEQHNLYVKWEKRNRDHKEKYERLDAKRTDLIAKLSKHVNASNSKELANFEDKVKSNVRSRRDAISSYSELQPELKGLKAKLSKLGKPEHTAEQLREKVVGIKSEVKTHEAEIERLENLTSGKCPLCGSEFDRKHMNKELDRLRDKVKNLTVERKNLETLMDDAETYDDTTRRLEALKEKISAIPSKLLDRKKLDTYRKVKGQLDALRDLNHEIEQLDVSEKPSKAKLHDLDKLEAKLTKVKDKLRQQNIAKTASSITRQLSALGFESQREVEKEAAKLDSIPLSELTSRHSSITQALRQREELTSELAVVNQQLDKIDGVLKRGPLIDELIRCYGNTGLKREVCGDLVASIEEEINQMSGLIFDEPIKFRFDVTPTDFHILYENARGIEDVRNLSGAEGRAFTVLSMLGILPLLPAYMRTNILVLDEMDANMDPAAKRMYCNDLIPALTSVIDHVIVVTPSSDIYPDSRTVVAVKSGNETRLEYE